ncbi:cyclic nucleotide-binding/CBS domain-containing protein [Acidianus manzaensis]|uniref:CBS domain-containing protein n=1 Tax=Acidianus manzaensis TaxID=282676 RepID=A0A1W6JYN2_9CREN|nr:CBS domain-containing protein [Acidianus manzaensis]ARM75357.1 hypothetical protein B6F84_04470 [Acidianus manzaensis]
MVSKKSINSYLIYPNSSIQDIIEKMKENEILILVDKFKKPLGFITKDYLKKLDYNDIDLEKIAYKTIVTIKGDEDPIDLLNLMVRNKLKFLVKTDNGKIKDIITARDVLRQIEKEIDF